MGRRQRGGGAAAGSESLSTAGQETIGFRATRIMAALSRDTNTPDLPGLAPASECESHATTPGVGGCVDVKLTVRLAPHVATKMTAQARAAGLSQKVYLATLISGAPAVLSGADHRRALAALTASNDEMARMAMDIHGLVRLLRKGAAPPVGEVEAILEVLSSDVRAHLKHSSRLIADLSPLAATLRAGSSERADSGGNAR